MRMAEWFNGIVAAVALIVSIAAIIVSARSDKKSGDAQAKAAEALERAHPPREQFAFTIEPLPGKAQRGQFRLRNVGESKASHVSITLASEVEAVITPKWATDGPHTLDRDGWEDVMLSTVVPYTGHRYVPKEVLVSCDEHPDPIRVEVPYPDIT